MEKLSTKIITGVVLFTFAVGTYFFVHTRNKQQSYDEAQIARTDIHKSINVDALMKPNVYADIRSELPTLIKSVSISKNDQVEKGQELFELDKKSISAQIANAKLAVQKAELAEKLARRKWDILKPEEKDSIKKTTQQARENLRELYAQANKTTITSPIDGVVIEQNARLGEVAQGTIVKIIDPQSLQVEVLVPEVDIAKVKVGDRARIVFDAYPNKIIEGTFRSMDSGSTIKQNNTYFKAIVSIDNNKDNLTILDGMNASVDIETASKKNVLAVPRDFAKKDNKGYFVYVLNKDESRKEGQFGKKYFKAGLVGDNFVEVISGLSAGDKIILPKEDK